MKISENIIGYFKARRIPTGDGPVWWNSQVITRDVEPIHYNDAPDRTKASDFNDRPARMPKAILGLDIANWQSNGESEFGMPIIDGPAPKVAFLFGRDGGPLTFNEKSNIVSPQSIPYGTQFVVDPNQEYYPLMGA